MENQNSSTHIPSLDGLRAISITIVFLAHADMPLGIKFPGGFGVTVFFFLSGYLITTLMRREYLRNGAISFRRFYLRRALRILPTFYLVLIAALIAKQAFDLPGYLDPGAVLAQLLHYTNYWIVTHSFDGLPNGTGVFWSLAVEEHFYLVFPVVFIILMRSSTNSAQKAVILFSICLALLAWRLVLQSQIGMSANPSSVRIEIASDTRVDSLLFGCILALYGNPAMDATRISEKTWKYALLPISLAGLMFSFLYRDEFFRDTLRYTIQGICLVSVFVCAVRYPNWAPMRLLNLRPMAFLGVLSYGLYLVHQVVLAVVEHELSGLGSIARGAVAFGISVLTAWILYTAIEKPCGRLRHHLRA